MKRSSRWIAAGSAAALSASALLSGLGAFTVQAFGSQDAEEGTLELESSEFDAFLNSVLGESGLSGLFENFGDGEGASALEELGLSGLFEGLEGEGSEAASGIAGLLLSGLADAEGSDDGSGLFGSILSEGLGSAADALVDVITDPETYETDPVVWPLTIDNGDGADLVLEEEPQRIVSVSPSITEILYAIGAGDKLIARSDYCNYPEEVLELESVGQIYGADMEKILSLEPDLVVASAHFPDESIAQLEDAGIQVLYRYDENSYEGVTDIITTVGEAVNRKPEAAKVAAVMAGRIALTSMLVSAEERVPAYYVIGYGEYGDYTATGDTYINELLECAGAKNIAGEEQGWSYSVEKLLEEDPEVIFVPAYAYDDFIVTEPYSELTAVREGKVYAVNNDLLDRQTPRNADIVVELAELLHPAVFEKLDGNQKLMNFLKGSELDASEADPEESVAEEPAA